MLRRKRELGTIRQRDAKNERRQAIARRFGDCGQVYRLGCNALPLIERGDLNAANQGLVHAYVRTIAAVEGMLRLIRRAVDDKAHIAKLFLAPTLVHDPELCKVGSEPTRESVRFISQRFCGHAERADHC